MEKQIKNLYPIMALLKEESIKALLKFVEPYTKREVNNNKSKKKIHAKRR